MILSSCQVFYLLVDRPMDSIHPMCMKDRPFSAEASSEGEPVRPATSRMQITDDAPYQMLLRIHIGHLLPS